MDLDGVRHGVPRQQLEAGGLAEGRGRAPTRVTGYVSGGARSQASRVQLEHLAVARDQHGDEDALQTLSHVVGDPERVRLGQLGGGAEGQHDAEDDGELERGNWRLDR